MFDINKIMLLLAYNIPPVCNFVDRTLIKSSLTCILRTAKLPDEKSVLVKKQEAHLLIVTGQLSHNNDQCA